MNRIDDALIEKFYSPLCGWMHQRFDIGQWRSSIECLNGSVAFYIAAVAFEIGAKGPADGIFVTMLRSLVWLLILEAIRRRAHRQAASSVGIRTARAAEWTFRLALAAMVPFSLCYVIGWSSLFYSTSLLLLVFHLYFKAAETPPPEPRGKLAHGWR